MGLNDLIEEFTWSHPVSAKFLQLFGTIMSVHWATHAIEELQDGKITSLRPKGTSMEPKIESGALVTLEPITDPNLLSKGDVVLVAVGRTIYLHLIGAVEKDRVLIMNNKGRTNGWVKKSNVYGKVVNIQD